MHERATRPQAVAIRTRFAPPLQLTNMVGKDLPAGYFGKWGKPLDWRLYVGVPGVGPAARK